MRFYEDPQKTSENRMPQRSYYIPEDARISLDGEWDFKFYECDFEENYVPKAFEEICKQFLIRKNRLGKLEDDFEKIGKYYYDDSVNHKNGEFDVVTQNDNSYVFYEAKFKSEKLDKNLIWKEIEQVNNTGLFCNKYGFFSKSGYKEIEEEYKQNLILYSLEDLFSPELEEF